MQHVSHEISLSDARKTSEMHQLVFILNVLHKLEEFNLSWNKVRYLRSDVFKLDMIASTVQVSFL